MVDHSLWVGLDLLLTTQTISLTLLGVLFGLVVGALPGLGPLMGIILMLPVAVTLPPVAAMGFLISIQVGGSCGGSISAILLGVPGTPLAAATLFDGYPMAKNGRASDAIGIAISASALGGLFGGVVLIFGAPLLAGFASNLSPPEYTMLALTGLLTISLVSGDSIIKGMAAGCIGLLLATIGTDEFSTGFRFTFDSHHMLNGFHIVALVVGLFAISEMVFQITAGNLNQVTNVEAVRPSFSAIMITLKNWRNLLRSSAIGAGFGTLPGVGGDISSFASYAVASSAAKPEEGYGEGAEGGIVATESANNSTVGGSLVPAMALGIPGEASSAVLIAAFIILGFFPGPSLFQGQPEIVSGVFLAYLLSNLSLLIIGIAAVPVFVLIMKLKKGYLIPVVFLMCSVGTFALQASLFDLWVMMGFGLFGLLLRCANYPLAPIVIGFILGPILENNLRRALLISREGYWIFLDRPVSMFLVVLNAVLLLGAIGLWLRKSRRSRVEKSAV